MASLTWWAWVWASSRRWWRTGKPGMVQSMGSQRVGYNRATEWQMLMTQACTPKPNLSDSRHFQPPVTATAAMQPPDLEPQWCRVTWSRMGKSGYEAKISLTKNGSYLHRGQNLGAVLRNPGASFPLTLSSRSSSLSSISSCLRFHSYSTWTCGLNFPDLAWESWKWQQF